ncbi:hypothetical protein F5884DRAFT_878987 [Xylogone sp. PMI_703]|nr:hypothetical protein F5884DRAFT_878987 [Xylogone sp. PMI_703]
MAASIGMIDGDTFIGQGYNSYTQKKCYGKAVTITPEWNPAIPAKSQNTSFSWDYVSTFSDISKSIGVSAALTINAGGFSGTGKGDFINEEIVRNSDIRFIVKSKVINLYDPVDKMIKFNLEEGLTKENFLSHYGDCFVASFEQGGEFFAMVNVTISDSSKKMEIKGEIEAGLKAIQAKGSGGFETAELEKKANFAITVHAVGGKPLKPGTQEGRTNRSRAEGGKWDISSMLKAATEFPQQVLTNPAVLHANLSPYTAASGFIKAMKGFEAVSYNVAQSLTDMWLDDFTFFKLIISDIDTMKKDLDSYQKVANKSDAFELTLDSLQDAINECRTQRTMITRNVDSLTKDPRLASAEDKDERFKYKKPGEIKSRLPVKKIVTTLPATTLSSLQGSSLVCCIIMDGSTKSIKLYWQHENGSIMESTCRNSEWSLEHREVVAGAMPNTPLAAVSDDKGEKIRIFYLNKQAHICERVGTIGNAEWSDGEFTESKTPCSPITHLAVRRQTNGQLRLFYQGRDNRLAHEVLEPGAADWTLVAIPAEENTMVPGSSLAVAGNTKAAGATGSADHFSVFFQAADARWTEIAFDPTVQDDASKWKKIDASPPFKLCRPGSSISSSFVAGIAELYALYPSNEIWMVKYQDEKWSETARVCAGSLSAKFAVSHWSDSECRIYVSLNKGVMEMGWDDSKKTCKALGEIGAPKVPS